MKRPHARKASLMGEFPALYLGLNRRLRAEKRTARKRTALAIALVIGCAAFIAYTIYIHTIK